MKLVLKDRGNFEKANKEKLNKLFEEVLGREASKEDIRLFPYLTYSLQDQRIDIRKSSYEEEDFLEDYTNKGLFLIEDGKIGCTKEFWDFLTNVVYETYICEID